MTHCDPSPNNNSTFSIHSGFWSFWQESFPKPGSSKPELDAREIMMKLLSSDQPNTFPVCNQGWYALKRSVQTGLLEATAIVNSNNEPKIEYDDEEKLAIGSCFMSKIRLRHQRMIHVKVLATPALAHACCSLMTSSKYGNFDWIPMSAVPSIATLWNTPSSIWRSARPWRWTVMEMPSTTYHEVKRRTR